MWTARLKAEEDDLQERLSYFHFKQTWEGPSVEGVQYTSLSNTGYLLSIPIPRGYPDEMPRLYIASPHTLPKRDGGSVNQIGSSHEFHTQPNGPGGIIQVCHCNPSIWHASRTLFSVLVKGIYWCLFYDAYMRTGRSIAWYFDEWRKRHNS